MIIYHVDRKKMKYTVEEYEIAVDDYENRLVDDEGADLIEIIDCFEADDTYEVVTENRQEIDLDINFVNNVLILYWYKSIMKYTGYSVKNVNVETATITCDTLETFTKLSEFFINYANNPSFRRKINFDIWWRESKEKIQKFSRNWKYRNNPFTRFHKVARFVWYNYTNIARGKIGYVDHVSNAPFNKEIISKNSLPLIFKTRYYERFDNFDYNFKEKYFQN